MDVFIFVVRALIGCVEVADGSTTVEDNDTGESYDATGGALRQGRGGYLDASLSTISTS